MGRKKPTARVEESASAWGGGASKSNKKGFVIDDDEFSIITELSEETVIPEEKVAAPLGNKKKGKRGDSKNAMLNDDDYEEEEEDAAAATKFGGKKKARAKKSEYNSGFVASTFGLLGEDGDEELGLPGIPFSAKKKPSKSKKKKSSKGSKKTSFSSVLLEEENDPKVEDGFGEGDQEDDIFAVTFLGKKKSSKKKNINDDTAAGIGFGDAPSDIVEHGGDCKDKKPNNEDVASKNKKKKKKGGKNLQEEEEDLDKILADLGAGPSVSKPLQDCAVAPPEEKLQNQPPEQEEAEEEGHAETATSKKKKKKKDKDKEQKASVAEEKPEDTNSKVTGKKVPKHVREMQERLAKLKEAEETKKHQEEEKLRKEEEERLKQEELDRLAEEKKRLKKEREKEKLLKKKQEGKLLTGKQKEEARRLEAMRKQILANAKMDLPTGEPTRRPLYHKKKSKPQNQSNGVAISENWESTDAKEIQEDVASELASVEAENIEEVESPNAPDKSEVTDVDEEEEEDDDEEWDAKSWDEADSRLPGKNVFANEEVDSESEPLPKKDMKNTWTAPQDAELHASKPICFDEKVISVRPPNLENVDVQKNSVAEGNEKNNKNNSSNHDKKNKIGVVDDQPVQNGQNLRSPICCIMGHVDAGKTKLLDCIRGTRVQEGEAGGITQQIGATYFPAENIRERTKELKADAKLNVPGLLVIDTPGHESFTKLRSRGSGLCDLAILVVDLMHGLEPQTIESLNLLKSGNTDFVIALNKVDRLYGWETYPNAPIRKAIRQQSKDVMIEFNMRLTQVITQFKEQGLNTELYYKNKEMGETYNIVPTSAISGEGIPDLLLLLVQWAQKTMIKRLTYSEKVQCTILEVKVDEGHGTTIDVVLVNGVLHEGDQIVVGGMQGPIVTSIRALLTPHPMREFRVKGTYLHHKEIKAAQCIKIAAQGLDHAIPGASLYVVGSNDDIEVIGKSTMAYVHKVMSRTDKSDPIVLGVHVVEGIVKIGTPICIRGRGYVEIGRVASIENNHKPADYAKKGQKVAIKIISSDPEEQQKMFGRHFEMDDELVSKISRKSLDVLKDNYADELSAEETKLLFKLKKWFKIK
ncbi:photosystem II [Salvia divinorum]|uniref:Eukaryotic translation initiation factor 5B n=1 Tax=Salvia divinorum TaxID=28513 RepID=A0ABD1GGA7_SALDI